MSIELKTYLVKKNPLNEALDWSFANDLEDFSYPWLEEKPSKTVFKALYDANNFYFKFEVFDDLIYINTKDNSVDAIANSDRVELFFKKDDKLDPYYCLEMDANGRLLDFKAKAGRQFDYHWSWPKDKLRLSAQYTRIGYEVTGIIPLEFLKELGVLQENKMETGVYRAKYKVNKEDIYEAKWISWVDPATPTPEFHCASSFGIFIFEQE